MTAISPEALLQHAGFVRALARELLRSSDRVDDVVQETMLAALRRTPRDRSRLRAWLGAVGRKIALSERRSDGRRPRREREAARSEALPSAAEVAAQLETQRLLVEAVQQLEEPYRSTITHRFFRERSVREIAAELGVPVKTVESRLTRALQQLRARLDREHGGGGRAWTVALLPLAFPSSASAAAVAGASVAATLVALKVAAAAACVAVVALGVAWLADSREPVRRAPALSGPLRSEPVTEAAAAAPAPEPVDSVPEPEAPAWTGGVWRARLLGGPDALPETVHVCCEVRTDDGALQKWTRTLEPDASGAFAITGLPAGRLKVRVEAEGFAPWHSGHTYVITKSDPDSLPLWIRLSRGSVLALTLRDVSGRPLAGERLELRGGGDPEIDPRPAESDDNGRIAFPLLARGVYHFEWKGQIWYPWINGERDTEITLVPDGIVSGTVTNESGAAVPGAEVRFARDPHVWTSVVSDEAGRYRVVGLEPGPWRVTAHGEAFAVLAGTFERDRRAVAELPIHFQPGCLRGRLVRDRGGEAQRASVTLRGAHHFSMAANERGEFAFWGLPAGEYTLSYFCGGEGPETAVTLAPGEIRDMDLIAERPRHGTIELDVTLPDGSLPDGLQFFVSVARDVSTSAAPKPIAPGRFVIRLRTGPGRIIIGATRAHGAAVIDVEVHENRTRVVPVTLPPPDQTLRLDATR